VCGTRGITGTIASIADYSGTVAGTVKVTDTAHGLLTGNIVSITGTTNYNGIYTVTKIDANSFYITATWGATETGAWATLVLHLSTDGGATWAGVEPDAAIDALPRNSLWQDGADATRILIAASDGTSGKNGVKVSTDTGGTWAWKLYGDAVEGHQCYCVAGFSDLAAAFLAGTKGGLYRSLDSGVTWTPCGGGMGNDLTKWLALGMGL
jgi:hypothetical protein